MSVKILNNHKYNQAIEELTSQGKFHISLGLDRISKLLELLGNPHKKLQVIHVAGTNGKGSTCAMLASILAEAGYKTGLYTSPHILEYTERVKINGVDISQDDFAELVHKIIELAEQNQIPVTEFEILTALAFVYFNSQKVDYVVLETGLGGRLDATNVIDPLVSIITTIDLDHIDRLGDTIDKIAFEKAGIIKENKPVISLINNKGLNVIEKIAVEKGSKIIKADSSDYKIQNFNIITPENTYEIALLGLWQVDNLALVLKAVEYLRSTNINIPETAVKQGLKTVKWPARMQYIKEKNLILDGAHNVSGAELLRKSLDFYFPEQKRIWIYSSLTTKDYEGVIKQLFSVDDVVICTKSQSSSAVEPDEIYKMILNLKISGKVYVSDNASESLNLAQSLQTNNDIVIVAGSFYTVGDILSNF